MATRSTIAVQHEDGTVSQIYCHSDGYLSYNGTLLVSHYNTLLGAEYLVSKGDLSCMGKTVGKKIDFNGMMEYNSDHFAKQCRYYGRDRGETGTEPKTYASVSEYFDKSSREDYNYFFNGEFWEVEQGDRKFMSVTDAMNLETEDYE
jgi:hypothetical protein